MTLTITAKGQVTLKKDVLKHLGVTPGDKLKVNMLPNGTMNVSGATAKTGSVDDVIGFLAGKTKVTLTIDEINKVIARSWAGER